MSIDQNQCSTKKLQGKVALITGGASGIGEATVHVFAEHGVRAIVIADIQDEKGKRVAEAVCSNLIRCSYVHCDVTDEDQVKDMVDWTVQMYGQLDIMFSNAGVVSPTDQTILDLNLSKLDQIFAVNVRGMAACVKHAARVMVEGSVSGSIICTASVSGSKGARRRTDYVMSKHAVIGLVRSASLQLGVHGIRVNSVSPSAVATPGLCRSLQKELEEVEKMYEPLTCLKGIVLKVKHVADAVAFLASDESAFVTGHDLSVDGGFTSW
ncbi:(-)-isopiperitenol/(-)-carveol dehydrogenase, mitochondrial-like [Lycium barbarum]|uniref:(-)-isopiperitenol/(-)-carveol dehydrogenase, mitochondrial-like n=1 Tax=Lycium barbarum TaxID=112863 RepID=UPI00293F781E|nr:(-)-isopiperitenol/(-)-carveol dehydrogenase, mitochondrial-like [Lycium barbarum]